MDNSALIVRREGGVGGKGGLVSRRRERAGASDSATAVLSLSQFTVSILAYLSVFV